MTDEFYKFCPDNFPFVISRSNLAIIRQEKLGSKWRVSIGVRIRNEPWRRTPWKFVEIKTFPGKFKTRELAIDYAANIGFGEAVCKSSGRRDGWTTTNLTNLTDNED